MSAWCPCRYFSEVPRGAIFSSVLEVPAIPTTWSYTHPVNRIFWEVFGKFFSEVCVPAKKKVLRKRFWENPLKPIRSQARSCREYSAFIPVLWNPNEVLMCVKRCQKCHTWVLMICSRSKTSEEALPTSLPNLLDIKNGYFEKFLGTWFDFADIQTQMKYYVCKFCHTQVLLISWALFWEYSTFHVIDDKHLFI